MGGTGQPSGIKPIVGFLAVLTAALLFIAASITSYSDSGYTLTHYPGSLYSEFTLCVEGDVNPTQQQFMINDSSDKATTVNPYVIINDKKYAYNASLENTGLAEDIKDLKLGCNRIRFGSAGNSEFQLTVKYKPHLRPAAKSLQIRGLKAGEDSVFFSDVEDAESYKDGLTTSMTIKDVTRSHSQPIAFNDTFSGLKKEVSLEMGNYLAEFRVSDGVVWSDTYQAPFTVTVVRVDEYLYLKTVAYEKDDDVQDIGGWIPVPVGNSKDDAYRKIKRGVNGAYVLSWRAINHMNALIYVLKEKYLN